MTDPMASDPMASAWPAARLGEALQAIAAAAGIRPQVIGARSANSETGAALDLFIEQTAAHLGLEAEPIAVSYNEIRGMLSAIGPSLLRVGEGSEVRFLALIGRRRSKAVVLHADRSVEHIPLEKIASLLSAAIEKRGRPEIERVLVEASIAPARKDNIRRALLREWYGGFMVEGIWLLRLPPGARPLDQVIEAGLHRRAAIVIASQVAVTAVAALAWWTLGRALLEDQLDRGWLYAWLALLLTGLPLGLAGSWSAGLFAIDAGALLKRRLLAGALALEPDEVRHEGAGGFLSRVVESEAVESLALGAGISGVSAVISLFVALGLVFQGAGGAMHAGMLLLWCVVSGLLVARYYRRRRTWTDTRLALTNDLVERMNGHRTRLAQEPRDRWHDEEAQAIARYLTDSKTFDHSYAELTAFLPRGWSLVGILGLVPAFVGGAVSMSSVAISLGGVLVAGSALQTFVVSLANLASVTIAWRRVAPLFHAAARLEPPPPPLAIVPSDQPRRVLLDAHGLVFRHGDRAAPVLRGANLRIASGDRLLLEGPSGSGKSTLSSLLAGLRAPESGLLLLEGFDRSSLGGTLWRRRVVATPQFHENHVLQASLAFNLLMGRVWPPSVKDVEQAEAICRELGLGALIDRMPSGLNQIVGETGWQLSHGERSRVYIARALLQGADVLLFDESFGALDPETLAMCMRAVLARAPTIVVIAHP